MTGAKTELESGLEPRADPSEYISSTSVLHLYISFTSKAAFDLCALRTSPNPDSDGCPQTINYQLAGSGKWQVIRDPTNDIVVTFDKNMNLVATGHYQMVYAYQPGSQGVQHLPSSGGYSAALNLTADAITVGGIKAANGVPVLTRPEGASDLAAMNLVAQAIRHCATVRGQYVPDCPQSLLSVATNVRWTLSGNPLAGAIVTFDQDTGQLTVHGNFAMTVSYLFFGNPRKEPSFNSRYIAYLVVGRPEAAAGHDRWLRLAVGPLGRGATVAPCLDTPLAFAK